MDHRPRWALFAGLFVVVSCAVYGVARWQPFEPSAPAPVAGLAPGDPAAGQARFASTCAGCHGDGGTGGGIGPRLVGAKLDAATVAGVIAAGRGAMPAGLVSGQTAADVSAYVAQISGGAVTPPGATTGATTTPAPPAAAGGIAGLQGPRLAGLAVDLNAPAIADWGVWVDGPAGRRQIGTIRAGEGAFRTEDAGLGPLVGGGDRILVGPTAGQPALTGTLTADRAAQWRRLFITDPSLPGGASTLDAASGQVRVMREHIRFLVRARAERNLANIRFHGEHMVNITYGNPPEDVDGNGDASNPGDGVGLLGPEGGRPGYLPRILRDAGTPAQIPAQDMTLTIAEIATAGRECGTATSVAAGTSCVGTVAARSTRLARLWAETRAQAVNGATITLEAP